MRNFSHSQNSEPFLEKLIRDLRFFQIKKRIIPGTKILDLGCGYNGDLLKSVENIIESGIGIDLHVRNINSPKIQLLEGNLEKLLPFADNSFDIVTSLANLEHLENPKNNLNEIFRVLRKDGILLLTTPSRYSRPILEFLAFRIHLISQEEIKDHKNYFNRKNLIQLIKQSRFSSWKHYYFELFMNNLVIAKK